MTHRHKTALAWAALCAVGGLGAPTLAAANGSCLAEQEAARTIKGASVEPADDRMSVLRPCAGEVTQGKVEVIYSTGGGFTNRLDVRSGDSVESAVQAAIGPGKQLVDIWPERSILAAVVDLLAGRTPRTSSASGFDIAGLSIAGEVLPMPGTAVPLKLFGWAPDQPVQLSQDGWSATATPEAGRLALPVSRLKPGALRLAQGERQATVTVLALDEVPDVVQQLAGIKGAGADARMRRAVLLQEQQFFVNAVSEYAKGQ